MPDKRRLDPTYPVIESITSRAGNKLKVTAHQLIHSLEVALLLLWSECL